MKKILALILLFTGLAFSQVVERTLTFPDSTVGYTDSIRLVGNEVPRYIRTNQGLAQIDTMYAGFSFQKVPTEWYKVNVPFVVDSGYVTPFPEEITRTFKGLSGSDSDDYLWIKLYGVSDTTRDTNSVPFIIGTRVD